MTIKSIRTGWTGISALAGNSVIGDFESISTVAVGAGGVADVTFTSIPNTYQHLQIRGIVRSEAAATGINGVFAQFNTDTASNYSRHNLIGDGASVTATATASTGFMVLGQYPKSGDTANSFGAFIADILDYSNTNRFKTLRTLIGTDLNGSGQFRLTSGNWRNTNAISSIKIYPEDAADFAQYSHFALYGIR